jgi:hypothetical protein
VRFIAFLVVVVVVVVFSLSLCLFLGPGYLCGLDCGHACMCELRREERGAWEMHT